MSVTDTAAELTRTREPFVQATVVRAQKPTSAHAGDTALVRADGVDRRLRRRHLRGGVGARVRADDAVDQPAAAAADRPGRGAPGTREEGAVTVANPCLSGGAVEIFLEPRRAGAAGARRRRQPDRRGARPSSAGRSASTSSWSRGSRRSPRPATPRSWSPRTGGARSRR